MANALITPTVVVNEGLRLLENELVLKPLVYNDYSDDVVRGTGGTVTIRRPISYQAGNSMTIAVQDAQEGSTTVSVDKVANVAIQFTDLERTLTIDEMSDRILRPAMRVIANKIDRDIGDTLKLLWSHVGTPGNTVDSWTDFARAPQRLMEMAVPEGSTNAVFSPADGYALAGSFTNAYVQNVAGPAIERAKIPTLPGVAGTYMTNNMPVVTSGTRDNDANQLTNGTTQTSAWSAVKSTYTQTLVCDGFDAAATVKKGEVFTLGTMAAGMVAVNPVPGLIGESKPALPYLQQFVVQEDATADGGGNITLTISPPIITSGPYQTVSMTSANTDGLRVQFNVAASTAVPINAVFHKNAVAFVSRPLEMPPVADAVRKSYKGVSMRMAPIWDGINSVTSWRLDVIYGVKLLDGRLGTKISG